MKLPGNLGEMFEQAQRLQSEMTRLKDEAATRTVEASAGAGLVTVTADGTGAIKKLTIDKSIINPEDPQMLEDLVRAAVNDANNKVKESAKDELQKLTGGISIPGFNP